MTSNSADGPVVPPPHSPTATSALTTMQEPAAASAPARPPGSRTTGVPGAGVVVFGEGDRCEANFQGLGVWFSGRVLRVHADRSMDIAYDDGDVELRVRRPLVRAALVAGETCEGNFLGQGVWYPGTIRRVHEQDGAVDIIYDDGDHEDRVPPNRVRRRLPTTEEIARAVERDASEKNLWCHECQRVVGSEPRAAAADTTTTTAAAAATTAADEDGSCAVGAEGAGRNATVSAQTNSIRDVDGGLQCPCCQGCFVEIIDDSADHPHNFVAMDQLENERRARQLARDIVRRNGLMQHIQSQLAAAHGVAGGGGAGGVGGQGTQLHVIQSNVLHNAFGNIVAGQNAGGGNAGSSDGGNGWEGNAAGAQAGMNGLAALFETLLGTFTNAAGAAGGGGLASNAGDYVNSQEALEALMAQLLQAESGSGAPPTASSILETLPKIKVTAANIGNFQSDCAVCKDSFEVGGDNLHELPCGHYFHCGCILPWLELVSVCVCACVSSGIEWRFGFCVTREWSQPNPRIPQRIPSTTYLQHNTCPVCRTPLTAASITSASASSSSSSSSEANTAPALAAGQPQRPLPPRFV